MRLFESLKQKFLSQDAQQDTSKNKYYATFDNRELPIIRSNQRLNQRYSNSTSGVNAITLSQIRNNYILESRRASNDLDVKSALSEIVSEAILTDVNQSSNSLNSVLPTLSSQTLSKGQLTALEDAFLSTLQRINYNENIYNWFMQYIVDGMIVLELEYDNNNITGGIINVEMLDPYGFEKYEDEEGNIKYEYNIYSTNRAKVNFSSQPESYDDEQIAIAFIDNYKWEINEFFSTRIPVGLPVSVAKYINAKQNIEKSLAIYRNLYSFPRYAFGVPLGKMSNSTAQTYINSVKQQLKDDMSFDSDTYALKSKSSLESIRNHFIFPTRNNEKIEVEQVMGGDTGFLKDMEDLDYFVRKIYVGMHVPVSRLDESSTLDFSGNDILYNEKKFVKYVDKLRTSFSKVLFDIFKKDGIAKGIFTEDEWLEIKPQLTISFKKENPIFQTAFRDNFVESLDAFESAKDAGIVGVNGFISYESVIKSLFNMSTQQLEAERKLIEKEKEKSPHLYQEAGGRR